MKSFIRLMLIINISFLCEGSIFSQKFRTLEKFVQYYIENYKTLDKIEGIWFAKLYWTPDNLNSNGYQNLTIAIVKEDYGFKGYNIDANGYYSPIKYEISLTKNGPYLYKIKISNINLDKFWNDDIYVSNSHFLANFDISDSYQNYVGRNKQINFNWEFTKHYPSEEDLKEFENTEPV